MRDELTRVKRQLEKQRKLNRKKSAFIAGLKPYVSKKVWNKVLEEVV